MVDGSSGSAPGGGDISILIYNSDDSAPVVDCAHTTVDLTLVNLAAHLQSMGVTVGSSVNGSVNGDVSSSVGGSVDAMVALFVVDKTHANAHTIWREQGSPDQPSPAEFESMRAAAEVAVVEGYPRPLSIPLTSTGSVGGTTAFTGSRLSVANTSFRLNVSVPGVALLHICFAPSPSSSSSSSSATTTTSADAAAAASAGTKPDPPSKPTNIRLHRTRPPSRTAEGTFIPSQVMLKWDGVPERCIKSYVVEHSSGSQLEAPSVRNSAPVRVNPDSIFTSFLHSLPEAEDQPTEQAGLAPQEDCYTVTAVDYWGTAGASSDEVCV
jgi:hypothetical protein